MKPAATGASLLAGRNVLVTGAGAGIGRAISAAAATAGAQLVLLGRSSHTLDTLYDEIVDAGGVAPLLLPFDLAGLDAGRADEIAAAVAEHVGVLHGLVHNAALLGNRVPLQYYEPAQWHELLQVNLTAPFLLTRALLPALLLAEAARVLFMSSSVGIRARAYWGAYAVSKFGLEGLAQLLRDELDTTSAVRVHVVNPGATRTAMRATAYPAEDPLLLPEPAEHAAAIIELLRGDVLDARERIELQHTASSR